MAKQTGMSQIINSRYVLAVNNLKQSLDYYNATLGFTTYFEGEGWGFVKRDGCIIMLGECPESPPARDLPNHNYFAYIEVHDVQALYNEFKEKDAQLLTTVKTQPWGTREFALETIDGHRIMFGQEIAGKLE